MFGFRCVNVYSRVDWYRAFPALNLWLVSQGQGAFSQTLENNPFAISDEVDIQTRVLEKEDVGHESMEKECTFQSVDLCRWELVSRAWQKVSADVTRI